MTLYCIRLRIRFRRRFKFRALMHMLSHLRLSFSSEGNAAGDLGFYEAARDGFETLSKHGFLKGSYRTIDSEEVLFITEDLTEEQFRDFDAQLRETVFAKPVREFVKSRLPIPIQIELKDLAEIEVHPVMTFARTLEAGVASAKRRLSATTEKTLH